MPSYIHLFFGLSYLISLIILLSGFRLYLKTRATKKWLTTEGVITLCELTSIGSDEESSQKISLLYDYQIAGQSYTGTRCTLGNDVTNHIFGENPLLTLLTSGTHVRVYFDPKHPEQSILSCDARDALIIRALCSLLFFSFTVLMQLTFWCATSPENIKLQAIPTIF